MVWTFLWQRHHSLSPWTFFRPFWLHHDPSILFQQILLKNSTIFSSWQLVWTSLWQRHHSLPPWTFLKAILTSSWSTYLVWTNLINKLIMIFVLTDGLNFLYMCILNEWGSDQKRSAAYLGALHAKERICVTQPFRSKNRPNFFRSKSVIYIAVKASKLLWIFESHSCFFQTQQTKCNIFEWTFKVCVIKC